MPTSVIFPKANLEKTSGEISSWAVSEGDKVSEGDVLFEVEDDKAVVEVDSTTTGYIGGLSEVGEEIDVGAVVATIYETKEELEAAVAAPRIAEPAPIAAQAAPDISPAIVSPNKAAARSGRINPTPLARRIARDNGLSLDGVKGTGPRGRVQKRDVLALLERGAETPPGVVTPAIAESIASPVTTGGGTQLNAVWYQKGEGLPVAFLHGFGADYTSWGGLLSGARYDWPALALDLPCHGGSGYHLPADLDGIAADVEATLQAEGMTDLMVAAHSFGGAVAARMASRGILRIRALCLFAPAGLMPEMNAGFVSGMIRAKSLESLRPWLLQLVDDPDLINDVFCERSMAARATSAQLDALTHFAQQFFPDGTQRFSVADDLANYLGPLRVIYGRQDRILPVAATRNLPGNVALHLWDRCGHMPHFEHRREALRILEEVRRSA